MQRGCCGVMFMRICSIANSIRRLHAAASVVLAATSWLPNCLLCAQVYERRPEPKSDTVDTGRAYIIIVIPRGQAALKEVTHVGSTDV